MPAKKTKAKAAKKPAPKKRAVASKPRKTVKAAADDAQEEE